MCEAMPGSEGYDQVKDAAYLGECVLWGEGAGKGDHLPHSHSTQESERRPSAIVLGKNCRAHTDDRVGYGRKALGATVRCGTTVTSVRAGPPLWVCIVVRE